MGDKPTVYVETTIPSFLTARLSSDLIVAGWQLRTRQWWEKRRPLYDLYISEFVLDAAGGGDPDAAHLRLESLSGLTLLDVDETVLDLTRALLKSGAIPDKAAADAGHVAVAARYGLDFLLTWNCAHIANAALWTLMGEVMAKAGFRLPVIGTPNEMMGKDENEG